MVRRDAPRIAKSIVLPHERMLRWTYLIIRSFRLGKHSSENRIKVGHFHCRSSRTSHKRRMRLFVRFPSLPIEKDRRSNRFVNIASRSGFFHLFLWQFIEDSLKREAFSVTSVLDWKSVYLRGEHRSKNLPITEFHFIVDDGFSLQRRKRTVFVGRRKSLDVYRSQLYPLQKIIEREWRFGILTGWTPIHFLAYWSLSIVDENEAGR